MRSLTLLSFLLLVAPLEAVTITITGEGTLHTLGGETPLGPTTATINYDPAQFEFQIAGFFAYNYRPTSEVPVILEADSQSFTALGLDRIIVSRERVYGGTVPRNTFWFTGNTTLEVILWVPFDLGEASDQFIAEVQEWPIDHITFRLSDDDASIRIESPVVTFSVPEPSSLALLALGASGVLMQRRRRKLDAENTTDRCVR